MRITFLKITAGMLCAGAMVSTAFADGFSSGSNGAPPSSSGGYGSSSSVNPMPGGYESDSSAPPSTVSYESSTSAPPSAPAPRPRHKKHDRFSISLNIPGTDSVLRVGEPKHGRHHNDQPFWIPMTSGEAMPVNAVIGGNQYNPRATFYVCRADFNGGIHPGKYFKGNCNISWGGREVVMDNYEVLVSDKRVSWVGSSYGNIPHHALPGGNENNQTLYICQASYQNGMHTGKIVGRSCNFGWGGKEISVPSYNVLVG